MFPDRPTIFALSSGRPPAAIAVIRISGSRAGEALKALIGKLPAPRQAALVRVRDPQTHDPIDEALALWFPAPHSETGEDVAELQLHGGRAVIAATFSALATLEGLRPAEAGEFTRRAFENGKLDLTAVEGLADLVAAETQGQRRQALRQMQGALGSRAESWRERLIRALALAEAAIDFSDEADVPEDLLTSVLAIAGPLADEIAGALADGRRGERLREGLTVAIAGPPNAGKSTLLNRIARREAAIVSPYAGTTRDVIEVHLDLDGWPVTLLDTAGIRESDDPVEMEGVRRARERAGSADLVLWVVDAADPDFPPVIPETVRGAVIRNPEGLTEPSSGFRVPAFGRPRNDDADGVHSGGSLDDGPSGEKPPGPPIWLIRNKIDLVAELGVRNELRILKNGKTEPEFSTNKPITNMVSQPLMRSEQRNESISYINEKAFNLSAATSEGFDPLFAQLARYAENFLAGAEPALVTRERQRRALEDALAALRRALAPDLAIREDLLAEELRIAGRALERLTGRVDVEDILDVIFRDFCIGK